MKSEQYVRIINTIGKYENMICRVVSETEDSVCLEGLWIDNQMFRKYHVEKVDSNLVREVRIPVFKGFHFTGYELVAEWPKLQRDDRVVMCLVGSERPSLTGCVGSNPTPSAKIYEQSL